MLRFTLILFILNYHNFKQQKIRDVPTVNEAVSYPSPDNLIIDSRPEGFVLWCEPIIVKSFQGRAGYGMISTWLTARYQSKTIREHKYVSYDAKLLLRDKEHPMHN